MRGVRRDRYSLRAYVKVGRRQRQKRFPFDTPAEVIKAWRDTTRVDLRAGSLAAAPAGSLEADIRRYLQLVKAMPTYRQREEHLLLWQGALGATTPRRAITAAQIRAVLQQWRADGLSAATCNKRRSALMHLWSTLDGKGAMNPVRGVPKFRVDDPLPRGRDVLTIDAALRHAPRCRTRAVCRLMLWTGMRPVEIARLQADDVDTRHKTLIVRTAKGGRTRVVPLTWQALQAIEECEDAEVWTRGLPDAAPMNRLLKKWTDIPTLRIYDLRHTYGTTLARQGARLDVIGAMMGHSSLELTRRYLLAAVGADAKLATKRLARG